MPQPAAPEDLQAAIHRRRGAFPIANLLAHAPEPWEPRGADLDRLPDLTPDAVPDITESVRLLVAELGATPLIGFAGAPFTLASYLIEGGPSRNHELTKSLMHGDPELWHDLCTRLSQISAALRCFAPVA